MMMAAAGVVGAPTLTGTLWSWGEGDAGVIGNNATAAVSTPVQIGADSDWAILGNGHRTMHAIRSDGTRWGWGWNAYGGLIGNGSVTTTCSPVKVGTRTDWLMISAGSYCTFGLTTAGRLYANGTEYAKGAFGNDTNTNSSTPVQVGSDTHWAWVAGEQYSGAAIRNNGTLWTWGDSVNGENGRGSTTVASSPIQVGSQTDWFRVNNQRVGHIAAIKTGAAGGSLYTWGESRDGALGNNTTSPDKCSPVKIGTASWIKISSGDGFKIGIRDDYTMWSWGGGGTGRLGNDTDHKSTPTQIGTDSNWWDVATTDATSAGIRLDGTLWTWGNAANGKLGNGTTSPNISTPVKVGSANDWYSLSAVRNTFFALK